MSARTPAPTLLGAAGVIADLTSPVPDVGIDEECPICFESYSDGVESCLRLKACRHLVCKACIEKLDRTSNGLVLCPICRTSWLDVTASQETSSAATNEAGSSVLGARPIIDLTLDDDSALSDDSPREDTDATNRAIRTIGNRAYQQQVSRRQRWREFREARTRQRGAAEAQRRNNGPRTNGNTVRAIPLPGRIERPGHGKLRSVRRSLLDELALNPSERLTQARISQEPIIETEGTDRALQIHNGARASQRAPVSPHTDSSSDVSNRGARQPTALPQSMPRLGRRKLQETEPSVQNLERPQNLEGGELSTRIDYLERRKRELETRLGELHDRTDRPDHHTDPTEQRDAASSRKEASLKERERRL